MKYVYDSDKVRIKVCESNRWATKTINLKLQVKVKRFLFSGWDTVRELDIDVKAFWGYVPGDNRFRNHLSMRSNFGNELEVWPPDIFDLKARVKQMFDDYFKSNKEALIAERSLKKQINSL